MLEIPIVVVDDIDEANSTDAASGVPTYARPGDAAVDLTSRIDASLGAGGGRAMIPTGVSIAVPEGYAALVLSRSGLAAHHGVACLNAPGLIDSGFRGEIQVILVNTDPSVDYEVHCGDRVAQLMVVAVDQIGFQRVTELETTARGEEGFGHSGR
jgi:dUTP pyrophosphatase